MRRERRTPRVPVPVHLHFQSQNLVIDKHGESAPRERSGARPRCPCHSTTSSCERYCSPDLARQLCPSTKEERTNDSRRDRGKTFVRHQSARIDRMSRKCSQGVDMLCERMSRGRRRRRDDGRGRHSKDSYRSDRVRRSRLSAELVSRRCSREGGDARWPSVSEALPVRPEAYSALSLRQNPG